MATGDADDIVRRVKRLIPNRWFAYVAPLRDAILGGAADLSAWCYQWVVYARLQSRLATATGVWLDIWSNDFLGLTLPRNGATDDAFRALIQATILKERVTRAGMSNAVTILTGNVPWIFEPWNTADTGAYSNQAKGQLYGQMGYGQGVGGYGNLNLPGQVFMKVTRGSVSGVPGLTGYGFGAGGYKGPKLVNGQAGFVGQIGYVGYYTRLIGVTDANIAQVIVYTKPSGVTVWMRFQ